MKSRDDALRGCRSSRKIDFAFRGHSQCVRVHATRITFRRYILVSLCRANARARSSRKYVYPTFDEPRGRGGGDHASSIRSSSEFTVDSISRLRSKSASRSGYIPSRGLAKTITRWVCNFFEPSNAVLSVINRCLGRNYIYGERHAGSFFSSFRR